MLCSFLYVHTSLNLTKVYIAVFNLNHCGLQSMYHDRQGVAVVPPTVPGPYLGIPEKGTIKKQKSIGMIQILSLCVCVLWYMCVCAPNVEVHVQHFVLLAGGSALLMLCGLTPAILELIIDKIE